MSTGNQGVPCCTATGNRCGIEEEAAARGLEPRRGGGEVLGRGGPGLRGRHPQAHPQLRGPRLRARELAHEVPRRGSPGAGAGAPPLRYLVGELASAEAGPAELRLRLRMSAAQARASAPESLPSPAPGFQAASCSLFLDHNTQGQSIPKAIP